MVRDSGVVEPNERQQRQRECGMVRKHVALARAGFLGRERRVDLAPRGEAVAAQQRDESACRRKPGSRRPAFPGIGRQVRINGFRFVEAALKDANEGNIRGVALGAAGQALPASKDRLGVCGRIDDMAKAAGERGVAIPLRQRLQYVDRQGLGEQAPNVCRHVASGQPFELVEFAADQEAPAKDVVPARFRAVA